MNLFMFQSNLPDEVHPEWEYVNIDVRFDPDRDTLPVDRERPEPGEEEADQLALPEGEEIDHNIEDDVLVFNSGADKVNLHQHMEGDNSFLDIVRNNYINDNLLSKVVADVSVHKQFAMRDKLLFTKNQLGRDVLCILEDAFLRGKRLVEIIIDQAHKIIGHFGAYKTAKYIFMQPVSNSQD
ncbi:hypothetical protein M422DRAFT_263998 [Sphaerobolus stellatus SS14]|uniref:Integrase zinc-binding domain-containing protein n=1 Tax=Sphaerobolus stellatus (strain SS14) TaxID=990650 RepID=A0A0C9V9R6_SPHS4|nr:hypothetical protein M422DRAFT_263998 [Sphaerobolus stellatus SS14]